MCCFGTYILGLFVKTEIDQNKLWLKFGNQFRVQTRDDWKLLLKELVQLIFYASRSCERWILVRATKYHYWSKFSVYNFKYTPLYFEMINVYFFHGIQLQSYMKPDNYYIQHSFFISSRYLLWKIWSNKSLVLTNPYKIYTEKNFLPSILGVMWNHNWFLLTITIFKHYTQQ